MAKVRIDPPKLTNQDIERFWGKVDKAPGQGPKGDCWQWTAGRMNGYGGFHVGWTRRCGAHRIAFMLAHQRWPTALICHTCDNRLCCNAAHMFEGTIADNMRDRTTKGRTAQGEHSGQSKLTEKQVLEIRALYAAGHDKSVIAARFDVTRPLVHVIVNRKWWRHV